MENITSEMLMDMYHMNKEKGKALVPAEQVRNCKTLNRVLLLIGNNNTELFPTVVGWALAELHCHVFPTTISKQSAWLLLQTNAHVRSEEYYREKEQNSECAKLLLRKCI